VVEDFSLECEKRGYQLWNMVVGLGWKPRAIAQYLVNIPYLSRISNVIVVTIKLDLDYTDWDQWQTFGVLYFKAHVNFVLGRGSCLGFSRPSSFS
jgi:hypothetical protein